MIDDRELNVKILTFFIMQIIFDINRWAGWVFVCRDVCR